MTQFNYTIFTFEIIKYIRSSKNKGGNGACLWKQGYSPIGEQVQWYLNLPVLRKLQYYCHFKNLYEFTHMCWNFITHSCKPKYIFERRECHTSYNTFLTNNSYVVQPGTYESNSRTTNQHKLQYSCMLIYCFVLTKESLMGPVLHTVVNQK